MPVQKIWKIKEREINDELLKFCDNNKILAKLLVNRGINTKEKAEKFLNPSEYSLSAPDIFSDASKAAERIKNAINNKEHITVYGDFDADGITSTALLYLTLKKIGADADYYLPDRATESHGLNSKALVKLISKRKSKLIITVDCGISNANEVNFAKGLGTDIIITDHHEAPDNLPSAFAILNPKAQGSIKDSADAETIESLGYLAGVGVAFKLACKLIEEYKCEEYVYELLPLVAVGTIGDIVELQGENRKLTVMGLELIKQGKNKGITSLLNSSGITDLKTVTSETIAFQAVPRINAAGRLESPETAIKVLVSDDKEERETNVKLLTDLNTLRQKLCDETFEEARSEFEKEPPNNRIAAVLLNDNWHLGITGIVSSKIVEEYNRPAFLMTRDPQNPSVIRCSCRSIQGLNVHELLTELKDYFVGFGGHKAAAGFSFDETKISFEAFKRMLLKKIQEHAEGLDLTKTVCFADCELSVDDVTTEMYETVERLQPFGAGNPVPSFIINGLNVVSTRMMGQSSEHLKMFANKPGTKNLECIKWNCPGINIPVNSSADLLFTLKTNTFNNVTSVQLLISDIHSEYLKTTDKKEIKILDHRNKKDIFMQVRDFLMTTKKKTGIFVKNPAIKKKLSECGSDKITMFSRKVPFELQQLMFFDIPESKSSFAEIVKNASPEIIHIMNFGSEEVTPEKAITKTAGMMKYALSNLDGNIDIERMSDAIGISSDALDCILELFEDENIAKFERKDDDTVIIKELKGAELSELMKNDTALELSDILKNENDFKNAWLNADIEDFKTGVRALI